MRRIAILLVSALLLISLPLPSFAASKPTFFGPIVPAECKCTDQTVQGTGTKVATAPDYGCALQVVQNSVNFGVTLSIILFTIYFLIAGISMILSQSGGEAISKAKTRLTNVFVGLVVLLCAWLVIDYVMKQLYDQAKFGPWNSILAGSADKKDRCIVARESKALTEGAVEIVTGSGGPSSGTGGGGTGTGISSGNVYSDSGARGALASGGVNIANWPATKTLANTRADTINQAIEVKRACGCNVTVTATTGGTHSTKGESTHANGYKVDLGDTPALDSFLRGLTPGAKRSDGASMYYDKCGNSYAREKTHWDIAVTKGVCKL